MIPEATTIIQNHAFSGRSDIISMEIPEGVTSIEGYAFSDCTSLTLITIPSSVTSIGHDAFRGCSSLAFIIIPEHFANQDDDFWRGKGINRANTKLVTQAELDKFKKEKGLVGSYEIAELATLYSMKKDSFCPLQPRDFRNILLHDLFKITSLNQICLPDIIIQHQRIRLGRANIYRLLELLGKLASGGFDHVLNFLTVKDLAKISMAQLPEKSTAPASANIDIQPTSSTESRKSNRNICTIS